MNSDLWSERDVRSSAYYQDVADLYVEIRKPGSGQITDALDINVHPDGTDALFSAVITQTLEGSPPTHICSVDLTAGTTRILTSGPHTDRLPKYSPDGRRAAFLSDRGRAGDFQLFLLDPINKTVHPAPATEGWVEYFHWSPDGRRIVLGVAGHGADISGGQGAIPSRTVGTALPSWMPTVDSGDEVYRWRRAWVYELASGSLFPAGSVEHNVWEVVWCGSDALAIVASMSPSEGAWFGARLYLVDLPGSGNRLVHTPALQIGWPAASPSGQQLAIVEGLSSDRWIVAGDLWLIETSSGKLRQVNTAGVDITYVEWRTDRCLLLAGHRGLQTVVGIYDVITGIFRETWHSEYVTTGGRYISVSGFGDAGDCVLVAEGYERSPEIGAIRAGMYASIKSFDAGYAALFASIATAEPLTWRAADGEEIQGWVLRPREAPRAPVILYIHGGPVWLWRPLWLGRNQAHVLVLLKTGYAIFFPNPRGSAGRGQAFVRQVLGDMGGADGRDCLSGLDELVNRGWADPDRLGVMGASYGGFMTSWLITQDPRFAAAVSIAPHTNFVTYQLLSNQPDFVPLFLGDHYEDLSGRYFERSPIFHAHKAKTPTLNICGVLDRCTPAEEAVQFHNALREHHIESVLITYPEEGHGIRKFPALLDYSARLVAWFKEHLG